VDNFTARNCTSEITIRHRVVSSVTLLGNGFNNVAFSAFLSSDSYPCWLAPFSFNSWVELTSICQPFNFSCQFVKVLLRPTVSRPVCLGVETHLRPQDQIFVTVRQLRVWLIWGALSDEMTCLSVTIAVDSRQRSHSRVRVPRDSWTYFTIVYKPTVNNGLWVLFMLTAVGVSLHGRNQCYSSELYPLAIWISVSINLKFASSLFFDTILQKGAGSVHAVFLPLKYINSSVGDPSIFREQHKCCQVTRTPV
jgi:hypothetical protein